MLTFKEKNVTIKVPSKRGTIGDGSIDFIKNQIQSKNLITIKSIIDKDNNGDRFIIVRTRKNIEFIRNYNLNFSDIKNIIKNLSVEDCFSGPEQDRDLQYKGWIFKFSPKYEDIKLYIKIRVENTKKCICLSIHEFGMYDN